MERSELFGLSETKRKAALKAVAESGVIGAWEGVGATVNLVGSVCSGLIVRNLDIDLHIYTGEPMQEKSFAAIARLQRNTAIGDVTYRYLLDTPEECIEWHASYTDTQGTLWRLDMIHIRKGSAFDGLIERTTEAIASSLTPETREAVLRIKYDAPRGVKTPGIEVCYAVLARGVRSYEEYAKWKRDNPNIDLIGWMP